MGKTLKWFFRFTRFFKWTGYRKDHSPVREKPDLDRVVDWESRKKHLDALDSKRAEIIKHLEENR